MIDHFVLILIMALVTWRVARFIALDSLIEEIRDPVLSWLDRPGRFTFLRNKVADLLGCPWCLSIWISAAVVFLTRQFCVDSMPMPIWTWLAVSILPIVGWTYVDSDDVVVVKDPKD